MHILQILPALEEGGVERGTVELSRELVQRGIRSSVISSGGRLTAQLEKEGTQHITLNVKSKNPLTALSRAKKLRHTIEKLAPDLVHFRSRVPGWLFFIANRSLKLPFVSTVHGFNSVNRYSRIMTTGMEVIAPSTALAEHVKKHYQVPDAKLHVIHRGLDTTGFDPARVDLDFIREFKQKHQLDNCYIILAAGRITGWKGYLELVEAVSMAQAGMPPFKLLFVGGVQQGQETYAAALYAKVRELGLSEQTVFAGSHAKMAEIYHLADLAISNSTSKPETFGRSMVEALAMECPVIATRHGGALDIVQEGINGWLITPGNIPELAKKLQLAVKTPLKNLRADVVERFALQKMVDQTIAVYQKTLQDTGSQAGV